jgi:hypothetical protein
MPRRLWKMSRTAPARSILLIVSFLTLVFQLAILTPWVTPPNMAISVVPNVLIGGSISLWGVLAAGKNNIRQMSHSSFWMFIMWLWSGLSRIMFSADPSMLLWVPFIVLAAALGVVYIYLSGQKKVNDG